jgi:pimeloyl-ACP methyl ester carboxylesterase
VAAIERLAAPTLVLWGDQDPFVEQPAIDRLAELRPDWQLEEFSGVGHLLPVEVPDDYVRAVGAWLAGR